MHVGALVVLFAVDGGAGWRAAVGVLVGLSLAAGMVRQYRPARWWRPLPTAVRWSASGEWDADFGAGADARNYTLREYWCSPRLVILRLKPALSGRSLTLVLPWDAVPPEPFRRLRARLRLQSGVGRARYRSAPGADRE